MRASADRRVSAEDTRAALCLTPAAAICPKLHSFAAGNGSGMVVPMQERVAAADIPLPEARISAFQKRKQ